ncbi:MAG: 6,7-dimethyl-8-ribityllumazine synthase [bacterium]|nr:6,7-dimethyl-8-ribityllumazine synthase [bacterium]
MIGIVVSKFNSYITQKMLNIAKKKLKEKKIKYKVIEVAGAYEIPFGVLKFLNSKKVKGVITLGCIIKGETSHHKLVSNWASIGTGIVSIMKNKPATFGVITANNLKQAESRIKPRTIEAVEALVNLL